MASQNLPSILNRKPGIHGSGPKVDKWTVRLIGLKMGKAVRIVRGILSKAKYISVKAEIPVNNIDKARAHRTKMQSDGPLS